MIGAVCSKGFLHPWLILSILLSVMVAPLFQPAPVLATEPYTPTNLSPTGSIDTLTPTLQASEFSDPDDGDIQTGSKWEISESPSFSDATPYPLTEAPFNSVGPIGSLEYSTTYYWRVKYCDNSTEWSAWADASFTTPAAPTTPPSVSTASATGVAATSATLNGNLVDPGTAASVSVSFEWGLTTSYGSTASVTQPMTAADAFSASLTNLTPATTYHFRAVAEGGYGTDHGEDHTFTTASLPDEPPVVTTGTADITGTTSATLNGNLADPGTAASVQVSFEWGLTTAYGSTASIAQPMTAAGAFSASVTGLAPATTYHFRAAAVGDGTDYGDDRTFTTASLPDEPPEVTTAAATGIAAASATLNLTLTGLGTAASVQVSFEWGPTTSYGYSTPAQSLEETGSLSYALSGLAPETTYHFRARAVGDGTGYGVDQAFTTAALPDEPPEVTTVAASAIGTTSATLNLNLASLGSATSVRVSFEWGLTTSYGSTTTAETVSRTGFSSFALSGLEPATTYHFRAVAVGDGTVYGGDLTFTTGTLPDRPPEVSTGAATGTGTTSATLNLSVANLGTAASVQVSFEWGLTAGYGSATTPEATSLTGPFSYALSDLAPATTYHFRARAEGDGTAYGNDLTFTTSSIPAAPPEVTTQPASGTGTMSATLNLRLTSLGTAAAVQVSFEWGPTADYGSTTTSEAMDGTGILSFPISGLAPATIYHFRARAEGDGTAYGNDLTFTTSSIPAAPPKVTTSGAAVAASGSARLNGNLTSMGTAGSVMVSFVWGTTPGGPYPNETHGAIRTGNGTFYFDLSGLAPGTTCYFQARAVGDGTVYGEEKSFTAASGAPRIDSLLVISGRQGQDLTVKITGVNLGSARDVAFGDGVTVIEFSVVSDNEITARIAVGGGPQPETRDVTVTASGGTASYPIPSGFLMSNADGSSGADTGTKVHLWIYLAAVAGGLVGLSVVASLWWRWRAAK